MVSTESSEKAIAQHRLLVPRLSLMMFLQFFIWGSWSVTLGLVMTQHNMSLLIGDAFSAGPIASILSPFVLGMLVDRFFASQKVMAVMHLAGAAILWFVPGALIAENGALLIGHYQFGWRGQKAIRFTLIGFFLLALGFIGSKFVLEMVLGK